MPRLCKTWLACFFLSSEAEMIEHLRRRLTKFCITHLQQQQRQQLFSLLLSLRSPFKLAECQTNKKLHNKLRIIWIVLDLEIRYFVTDPKTLPAYLSRSLLVTLLSTFDPAQADIIAQRGAINKLSSSTKSRSWSLATSTRVDTKILITELETSRSKELFN